MNEQPNKPRRPGNESANPSLPPSAAHKKPHEYLLERGWFPLGDPEWPFCPWLKPGFKLIESYETVVEPMTGEVERHELGKELLKVGKIASNPEPRTRTQIRVYPVTTPMETAAAYRQQLLLDLQERERQLREEQKALKDAG